MHSRGFVDTPAARAAAGREPNGRYTAFAHFVNQRTTGGLLLNDHHVRFPILVLLERNLFEFWEVPTATLRIHQNDRFATRFLVIEDTPRGNRRIVRRFLFGKRGVICLQDVLDRGDLFLFPQLPPLALYDRRFGRGGLLLPLRGPLADGQRGLD